MIINLTKHCDFQNRIGTEYEYKVIHIETLFMHLNNNYKIRRMIISA